MTTFIRIPEDSYAQLRSHLLPEDTDLEQAAFLVAAIERADNRLTFHVVDSILLTSSDFDNQHSDYLELKDDARTRIIKNAHDRDAGLVELHSHPGPFAAAFSPTDIEGLRETVPQMWWRLKRRPYAALVVAASGFDALVWADNPGSPCPLDGLATSTRRSC